MCELFAMSSLAPTSVGFSLERLARRGGAEGPHSDGWGVAYYQQNDALLLREPSAASESRLAKHVERFGPPSALVISHIRLATRGTATLSNTQPFSRELGGRSHVFVHNGELDADLKTHPRQAERFRPIGETDSERVFCSLLNRLAALWQDPGHQVPSLDARLDCFAHFAAEQRALGVANFLYTDGDALFIHAHQRTPPGSEEVLPGLHVLERSCQEGVPDTTESGVMLPTIQQNLTLVASVPLTDEPWRALKSGEVLVIQHGSICRHRRD